MMKWEIEDRRWEIGGQETGNWKHKPQTRNQEP